MTWKIYFTKDAKQDLQNLYDYLYFSSLEPEVAKRQSKRIMDAADSLGHMPLRHRLYAKEPWHAKGLRFLPVDHYLIFYLPVESKNIVAIIRIMYSGRDIENQLNHAKE